MAKKNDDIQIVETSTLLTCYGFDLRGLTPLGLINNWLEVYSLSWIRWAVVEALYQGRYKAVSVEHLLDFWSRRGQPRFNFSDEFELLISSKLPKNYSENLIADFLDDEPPLSVPKSFLIPDFPAPPSLLEPILNKPPIILPDTELLAAIAEGTVVVENKENINSELDSCAIAIETEIPTKSVAFPPRSIHQFIPIVDESDLFGKLRTVVQRELAASLV